MSISGHTVSGVGASGSDAMHESQSLADVVVSADGTTTVGHYKLGKLYFKSSMSLEYLI